MRNHLVFVAIGCGLSAISCASTGVTTGAPLASVAGAASPPRTEGDVPPGELPSPPPSAAEIAARAPLIDPRTTEAVGALGRRDYSRVLALTESPSDAPTGAWLDYDRGEALTGVGRTDEAIEVFRKAALRFQSAGDDLGRSVAIWGGARALDEAGRCPEARKAYKEFEAYARPRDQRAADMAAAYAGTCRPLTILR
jgi:tetratricopeptide (TPR) repeat protein